MKIELMPKNVAFVLNGIMLFIVAMSGLSFFLQESGLSNNKIARLFSKMFLLDGEFNIPAAFSVLLILSNFFLLFLIALSERAQKSKFKVFWFVLSMSFLFLAFDEGWMIHEKFNVIMSKYIDTSNFIYIAWIIPYGIAFIVFSSLLIPFLIHLPSQIRKLFLISGGIYVFGALGMGLTGGKIAGAYGFDSSAWIFIYTIEEVLEMLGMIAFSYSLLTYIHLRVGRLVLEVIK